MTRRRKILLWLLVPAALMTVVQIIRPDPVLDLFYYVIGVPILILNAWEFFMPEVIDHYFVKPKELNQLPPVQEGMHMKKRTIIILIVLCSVLIVFIGGYSFLRSYIDQVPFPYALYVLITKLASKSWHILTSPPIIISLLVTYLLWLFRKPILRLFPGLNDIKAGDFSDLFDDTTASPELKENSPTSITKTGKRNASETDLVIIWLIKNRIDNKTLQFILEIDGRDITKPELLSKIGELGMCSETVSLNVNNRLKEVYNRGVFELIYRSLLPVFCSIERKNNNKLACFILRPGVREILLERLKGLNNPPEPMIVHLNGQGNTN